MIEIYNHVICNTMKLVILNFYNKDRKVYYIYLTFWYSNDNKMTSFPLSFQVKRFYSFFNQLASIALFNSHDLNDNM